MENKVCCSICFQAFGDSRIPTILDCGHTFCAHCISGLRTRRCPDCSQDILPGQGGTNYAILQYNREIEDAARRARPRPGAAAAPSAAPRPGQPTCGLCDAPGAWTCNTCKVKHLCAECSSAVHREGPASAHALSPWDGTAGPVMCSAHPQYECTRFCKQDKRAVCFQCIFCDHKDHETVEIDEEVRPCTQRLQDQVVDLERATALAEEVHEKWCREHEILTGRALMEVERKMTAPIGVGDGVIGRTVESIRRYFEMAQAQLRARQEELEAQARAGGDRKTAHVRERAAVSSGAVAQSGLVRARVQRELSEQPKAWLLENEMMLSDTIGAQLAQLKAVSQPDPFSSIMSFEMTEPPFPAFEQLGKLNTQEKVYATKERVPQVCLVGVESSFEITPWGPLEAAAAGQLALRWERERATEAGSGTGTDPGGTWEIDGAVTSSVSADDSACTVRFRVDRPGRFRLRIGNIAENAAPLIVHTAAAPKSFGSPGNGAGQFQNPSDICSVGGLLYITDCNNHRVQVWTVEGVYVRSFGAAGSGDGQFRNARSICSVGGLLYITDYNNHRVQVWTVEGVYVRSFGAAGSGAGQFQDPRGICSDGGLLYIADCNNHRVQVWTVEGVYVRSFGAAGSGAGQFQDPRGICSDGGLLYITDYSNCRVQVWTVEGVYVRSFGTAGSGDGQFQHPLGICSDGGLLYIADLNNRRVQVLAN